jgi:hypothetical protein
MSKTKSTQSESPKSVTKERLPLLFETKNYQLMIAGVIIIVLGFLLMLGANNNKPNVAFPADDVYSVRRIIIAPIVLTIGFLVELWAILYKKK